MCEYCDMTLVNVETACKDYFIHKPLHLRDEHTGKRIKANGEYPIMYLREYRNDGSNTWSLICEFADEAGTVIESPIIYCPRCGDHLIGRERRMSND